jgi:hypothetical protein
MPLWGIAQRRGVVVVVIEGARKQTKEEEDQPVSQPASRRQHFRSAIRKYLQ